MSEVISTFSKEVTLFEGEYKHYGLYDFAKTFPAITAIGLVLCALPLIIIGIKVGGLIKSFFFVEEKKERKFKISNKQEVYQPKPVSSKVCVEAYNPKVPSVKVSLETSNDTIVQESLSDENAMQILELVYQNNLYKIECKGKEWKKFLMLF